MYQELSTNPETSYLNFPASAYAQLIQALWLFVPDCLYVCPTWHNFRRYNERDPGDDDKKATGKIRL